MVREDWISRKVKMGWGTLYSLSVQDLGSLEELMLWG